MMRRSFFYAAAYAFFALLVLLFAASFIYARPISRDVVHPDDESMYMELGGKMRGAEETLQVEVAAGSRLPDCSRACGSCSPCRLVMVSFVCSSLQEAETCPVAYKCMCHNNSYPVP